MFMFGFDTWVLTYLLENFLEGFHHGAVWLMVGMGQKCQWGGSWVYSPIVGSGNAGTAVDRGIYCQSREHRSIIHCNSHYHGLVSRNGAAARNATIQAMVGAAVLDILGIRAGHAATEGGEETGME